MSNFYDILEKRHILFSRTPGGNTLIEGDVDLSGSDIASLPDNLLISGSLILRNCMLSTLPSGLEIMDDLDVRNSPIQELPHDIGVGGSLMMENTLLKSLPDSFMVIGNFDLEGSPIETLPRDLVVKGYLNIQDTMISMLPMSWFVEGPLLLDVEKIRSPIAWRRIALHALDADDYLIQNQSFYPSTGKHLYEEFIEIFTVWVCDEIRVFVGNHVGSAGGFERSDISPVLRQAIKECVYELKEKLDDAAVI